MEDFEIGVYDSELYYSGKLKEWLELRTKQYKFYPNDHSDPAPYYSDNNYES